MSGVSSFGLHFPAFFELLNGNSWLALLKAVRLPADENLWIQESIKKAVNNFIVGFKRSYVRKSKDYVGFF